MDGRRDSLLHRVKTRRVGRILYDMIREATMRTTLYPDCSRPHLCAGFASQKNTYIITYSPKGHLRLVSKTVYYRIELIAESFLHGWRVSLRVQVLKDILLPGRNRLTPVSLRS